MPSTSTPSQERTASLGSNRSEDTIQRSQLPCPGTYSMRSEGISHSTRRGEQDVVRVMLWLVPSSVPPRQYVVKSHD